MNQDGFADDCRCANPRIGDRKASLSLQTRRCFQDRRLARNPFRRERIQKPQSGPGCVLSKSVLKRNLAVALIVGCLLSVTNQLDALLAGNLPQCLYVKNALNFVIPFNLASVSAALNRRN